MRKCLCLIVLTFSQEVERPVEVLFLPLPFSSLYNLILHICEEVKCTCTMLCYRVRFTYITQPTPLYPSALLILTNLHINVCEIDECGSCIVQNRAHTGSWKDWGMWGNVCLRLSGLRNLFNALPPTWTKPKEVLYQYPPISFQSCYMSTPHVKMYMYSCSEAFFTTSSCQSFDVSYRISLFTDTLHNSLALSLLIEAVQYYHP